jgi:hypothetical protein
VSNHALFTQTKLIYLLLWTALCTLESGIPGQCAQSVAQSENLQRSKVVVVKDAQAIEAYKTRPRRIQAMLDRGMTNITSRPTPAEAWRSLLSTNDVVGSKYSRCRARIAVHDPQSLRHSWNNYWLPVACDKYRSLGPAIGGLEARRVLRTG